MMPHIKTAKKFLLIAKNAIKVFEQHADGQPQDKHPTLHGYITKFSFVIHFPSYEVEMLQPLEDCLDGQSQKPLIVYRSPDYERTKSMSVY
jgi:hypothetical protein